MIRAATVAGSRSRRWIEATLCAGRTVELELRGQSMLPALCDGDVLFVAPIGPLIAGDVVVARSGELLLAHRLVAVCGDSVVLRGDAIARPDPTLPASMVIGRVISVRRGARRLGRPRRRSRVARWLADAVALSRRLANQMR